MTPTPAQQARRRWLVPAVAAAAGALAAPTAVQAADQLEAVIRDPYNSSAVARLTEDGRLGVRGETTTQTGIPSNSWRAGLMWPRTYWQPVTSAPPGSAIGVSQITVYNMHIQNDTDREPGVATRRAYVFVEYTRSAAPTCPAEPPEGEPRHQLIRVPVPSFAKDDGPRQVVFPVPLTAPAAAKESTCLYAGASVGLKVGMEASGITGRPTKGFVPAKGDPVQQPDDQVTIQPSPDKPAESHPAP